MGYYFSRDVSMSFDDAIAAVTQRLGERGFGVLTTIDVRATLQKKLGVDFRRYTILGACNPKFALRALSSEANIGTMLPCNVVVQETVDGKVNVSAVDPVASMASVENAELATVAGEVRELLRDAVEGMG